MRFQSKHWILFFAGFHFLIHFILFLFSFSSVMGQFRSGEAEAFIEKVCQLSVSILQFPIVTIFVSIKSFGPLPSVLQYVPFVLNSGLWGVLLWLLIRQAKKWSGRWPAS